MVDLNQGNQGEWSSRVAFDGRGNKLVLFFQKNKWRTERVSLHSFEPPRPLSGPPETVPSVFQLAFVRAGLTQIIIQPVEQLANEAY